LIEGDDPSGSGRDGDDRSLGIEQRRLEERQIAVSMHDTALADDPSRPNRPQEVDVQLQGGLKLVRLEGCEQGWPDRVVPINGVCLDGDKLAIADPRSDNGVRVSADQFRKQARTAMVGMGDGAPARVDRFAAVAPSAQGISERVAGQPHPLPRERVELQSLSTIYVFLFQKPWEIPTCTAR
jgi:hypothetical protein